MLLDSNVYYFVFSVLAGGKKQFHEFITLPAVLLKPAMVAKPLKPKDLIYLNF